MLEQTVVTGLPGATYRMAPLEPKSTFGVVQGNAPGSPVWPPLDPAMITGGFDPH
jgi:hypothetical protein